MFAPSQRAYAPSPPFGRQCDAHPGEGRRSANRRAKTLCQTRPSGTPLQPFAAEGDSESGVEASSTVSSVGAEPTNQGQAGMLVYGCTLSLNPGCDRRRVAGVIANWLRFKTRAKLTADDLL